MKNALILAIVYLAWAIVACAPTTPLKQQNTCEKLAGLWVRYKGAYSTTPTPLRFADERVTLWIYSEPVHFDVQNCAAAELVATATGYKLNLVPVDANTLRAYLRLVPTDATTRVALLPISQPMTYTRLTPQ